MKNLYRKIYATPVKNCGRLRAELFLGRKFAVCCANPRLSSMAKRQKSSDAAPSPFPLRTITFYMQSPAPHFFRGLFLYVVEFHLFCYNVKPYEKRF